MACSGVKSFQMFFRHPFFDFFFFFISDVRPVFARDILFFFPRRTTSNGVASPLIKFQRTINPEKLRAFMGEQCPGWLVFALELEPEFLHCATVPTAAPPLLSSASDFFFFLFFLSILFFFSFSFFYLASTSFAFKLCFRRVIIEWAR